MHTVTYIPDPTRVLTDQVHMHAVTLHDPSTYAIRCASPLAEQLYGVVGWGGVVGSRE